MMLQLVKKIMKTVIFVACVFLIGSTSNSNGVEYSTSNLSLKLDLNSMAQKVIDDIENDLYSAKDTYSGYLTGYGSDCPLCSGYLACLPSLDVLHGNTLYTDSTYGTLNIVASSTMIPCGTVIRINDYFKSGKPMYAIVLDRGVGGNNLDLLTVSEKYAYDNIGRSMVEYDILRRGW